MNPPKSRRNWANDFIEKLKEKLEKGIPARALDYNEDEQEMLKEMFLLTAKPIIYIANISEEQINNAENEEMVKQVKEYASKENAEVIPLCVKIEEELSGLEEQDKKEMGVMANYYKCDFRYNSICWISNYVW